jgi:hypothetical protein
MYASSGNKHLFTKYSIRFYYEQSRQKLGTFLETKALSKSIFSKLGLLVQYSTKIFFFGGGLFIIVVSLMVTKCLFPLDAYMVLWLTRSKNLERTTLYSLALIFDVSLYTYTQSLASVNSTIAKFS